MRVCKGGRIGADFGPIGVEKAGTLLTCLRSSGVERPFRNRLVRGSNPRVGSQVSLAQSVELRSEVPSAAVRSRHETRNNFITMRR